MISGDESDGWDVEMDNIQEQIAAANDAERDYASDTEDPVTEVQEFKYILENDAMDKEEGNADDAEGGVDVYNSVTVTKKTHTIANLKDMCKAILAATKPRSSRGFGTVDVLLLYQLMPNHLCSNR